LFLFSDIKSKLHTAVVGKHIVLFIKSYLKHNIRILYIYIYIYNARLQSGGRGKKGDSRDGDVTYLISKRREFAFDFNKSLNQTILSYKTITYKYIMKAVNVSENDNVIKVKLIPILKRKYDNRTYLLSVTVQYSYM